MYLLLVYDGYTREGGANDRRGRTSGELTSLIRAVVPRITTLILEKQRAHRPRPERLCRIISLRPTEISQPILINLRFAIPRRANHQIRVASRPTTRPPTNRRTTAPDNQPIDSTNRNEIKDSKTRARAKNSPQLRNLNRLPPLHHRPAPSLLNVVPHLPLLTSHSQFQS